MIKTIYKKSTANIIFEMAKAEGFSSNKKKKTKMPTLGTSI